MSITDKDRKFAIEQAERRCKFHSDLGQKNNGRMAKQFDDFEITRRGLLGECTFANDFDQEVDIELRPYGDGGRDFWLTLWTKNGWKRFKVDVKTTSCRTVLKNIIDGMWLRIPVDKIQPYTIYVSAVYFEKTDDAELVGKWEWGKAIIEYNDRRFIDDIDVESYVKPVKECRDLQELRDRLKGPNQLTDKFVYLCGICGNIAHYGVGVNLRNNVIGTWYCTDHRPHK